MRTPVGKDATLLSRSGAQELFGSPRAHQLRASADAALSGKRRTTCWLLAFFVALLTLLAAPTAHAEVELPSSDSAEPIVASADQANRWQQGNHDVWVLRGNCVIQHGAVTARSNGAVLWIKQLPTQLP